MEEYENLQDVGRDRLGKLRRYLEGRDEIDRIQAETERQEPEIKSREQRENMNMVSQSKLEGITSQGRRGVRRADKSKRNGRDKARGE